MAKGLVEQSSLVAIADAIREKTGNEKTYTPSEMGEAIRRIETSGSNFEIPVFKGDLSNCFSGGHWDWFIENFGNEIKTDNISSLSATFQNSQVTEIPFVLNFGRYSISLSNVFTDCSNLKKLPEISSTSMTISSANYLFKGCNSLREIPEDYLQNNVTWNMGTTAMYSNMFYGDFSLRKLPSLTINISSNHQATLSSRILYYYMCTNCHVLDEIHIGVYPSTITSNSFTSAFSKCGRVTDITFMVDEDGSAKTAKWKSQVIDLTDYVGYAVNQATVLNYNSGITIDKLVSDDTTYQALKDDPDWWTTNIAYGRYNHDSAVRTINSLPDTSAYGTNTIKFKGDSGSATEGGAINTLSDEEIAVATEKGWTVTIV